jgi:hypothetical protein
MVLTNRSWIAALAVGFGALLLVSSAVAEEPKVSTYAPAADLASQADQYIKDLEKSVADEAAYKEAVDKIAKDSNTLVIVALALGLNDQDSKYKKSAGALMKAAQDVAATKDYDSAKKAIDAVKDAADGKGAAAGELKWEKAAALPELMKQVPLINTKLTMKIKGANFKKKAKDTAGYTAVLAAIAQGTKADHSMTKNDEQVKQWTKFSEVARDSAGALNAVIHKGDQAAVADALKKMNQSCEDCHAVFKPEKKD